MNKTFTLMMSAAVLGALALATPAQAAKHGVKVGELTCSVASGWGFVFGSSKRPALRLPPEQQTRRALLGLDRQVWRRHRLYRGRRPGMGSGRSDVGRASRRA